MNTPLFFEDFIDAETGELIKNLTDIPVTIDKEGAHMCTAMKEIIEESRQEGRMEGLAEGRRDSYATLTKSLLTNYPNMTLEEAQNMARKLLMMEE